MKKVNIIDVAQLAGVSVSTVSLVLRQKGKISEATIEKVNAAIKQLGYVHNVAAANLRSSTSNLIGLIIRDFNDSFCVNVMASVVHYLEKQGYMVFLGHPQDDTQQLQQCLTSFTQQGVAGVIYLDANHRLASIPSLISECPLPTVIIAESTVSSHRDVIGRDNRQAGNQATRYLLDRGHRNIAYLGGTAANLMREERLLGYRNALAQYDLPFREEWAPVCENDTEAAARLTRQLLEKNSKITAMLCHSPSAIIGCLNGIAQVGRTVGKDVFLTQQVSLIGFEDMMNINLTSPRFTYVSASSEEAGRQAATLIVNKIKEPTLPPQKIIISGELVQRESA
ncbi:Mal regulon transcriptional regulator MalI [Buttiauxella agrestis]|uniref:Maltose regulon regulatory protein n=1 Tax=Buttiauxella agrestis ATCC 33320 TaxID=1006004 RepID=A0A085GG13_9ENTR|nr:Mal regulon transcriptional regulator MalI [Buttiauxella agrestis]KFC82658.1 maltose regulon regulatory protein [Buttiauxella agrestis ATCC 33320]